MRYLTPHLENDLAHKMVFVGGPRQCGKTTLAQSMLAAQSRPTRYLNWDDLRHRRAILARAFGDPHERTVLDELHKAPRWKSWIKGAYDTRAAGSEILVTGSARLDVYRRGGDSLLGRYHYWRLHPFCLDELPAGMAPADGLARLMAVGGFPEPLVRGDGRFARRWRRERYDRVLMDDLRDLEQVRKISSLTLLVDLLRERVGSPVVVDNLAGELQVSPHTVKHWLDVLERMYVLFLVRPYTAKLSRVLHKAPKIYFYDTGDVVGDDGMRFENLVATHLLKRLQFWEDRDGHRYALCYIRDREKREVDFVVTRERQPIALIEAKLSDTHLSQALRYYVRQLPTAWPVQVVHAMEHGFVRDGIDVRGPQELFVDKLPLAHPEPLMQARPLRQS